VTTLIRHDITAGLDDTAAVRQTSSRPLVILGASARALAQSALRAGFEPYASDLFCDLDLQATARQAVQAAAGYPWSLGKAAAGFPPSAPWCYTGALENHPDLVDCIAKTRPLAGNAGDVLRRLRDPVALASAAADAGLAFPETLLSAQGVPEDGSFLLKPLAGAGGRGIRPWTRSLAADPALGGMRAGRAHVWQRLTAGKPFSAAYCLSAGRPRLVGLARQLIGEPWCHADRFAWCGAVVSSPAASGPVHDRLAARLEPLGELLAERFRAIGLVGVDLLVAADGRVTVVEANPRPTASMELYERSGAGSIAGCHLAACGFALPTVSSGGQPPPQPAATWAKAVLFATSPKPVSQPLIDGLSGKAAIWTEADGGWPAVADIPRPGQVIPSAAPVVTIFAAGHSEADALERLRDRVTHVDAMFGHALPERGGEE
jgi:predicted ATP-grasp superfamily ATP-dependent carboligase